MDKISGIYAITNTINGKRYVGSTINYHKRIAEHFLSLRKGTHRNGHLQSAFRKYGESCFLPSLLECVPIEFLLNEEQKHLDENKDGYNIAKYADATARGAKRSQEMKDKMRAIRLGKTATSETRKKIADAGIGRQKSQKTRDKLSPALKGIPRTAEWRAKLSAAGMGHAVSQEVRDKLSTANKGKVMSQEMRLKLSIANKGRVKSPEERAKLSASGKVRIFSPETRAKMSASARKYYERIKLEHKR